MAAVLGIVVTVLLPLTFPDGGGPTGLDRVMEEWAHSALGEHPGVFEALVVPSNAYILLPMLAAGVIRYASRRDWWSAGFLFVAPEVAVAANTWALKPVWHRQLQDYLAYPSGHTVHLVAIATAFVLLAGTQRTRVVEIAVSAVLLVAVAVGMVGLGYHYATDVLGGTAAAITLVTAPYAAMERLRRSRR
ncbi:phosphatase PAP2 family protein [Nocardia thraciensis]